MDPEAVKRLISDLEEICREHQEKLQKRIAQEGEREPSPSSPSSPSSPPSPPSAGSSAGSGEAGTG